jgi:hypothetical protein
MNRRVIFFCAWSTLFFFLFTFFCPGDAHCFDTSTLETTGIIIGITFGVALVVVLVVGTIRDLKGRPEADEEEDDVWTQHPVLRTLGYRPAFFPLFGEAPSLGEEYTEEARLREMEIEAFLQGKVEEMGIRNPLDRPLWDPRPFTFGTLPGELALSNPDWARKRSTPLLSTWRPDERS